MKLLNTSCRTVKHEYKPYRAILQPKGFHQSVGNVISCSILVFPDNQLIMHTKLNTNGIVKKLKEFNSSLQNTVSRVFTDQEILAIVALVDRISECQNTGCLLSDQEIGLLMELMSWPNDVLFPVLDIVKNALFFGNGYLLLTENPNFHLTLFIDSIQYDSFDCSIVVWVKHLHHC